MSHSPCCSTHGVTMACERYRRTHFVEVGPCCEDYVEPTVSWYITFGIGTPNGQLYTEVKVPASLPVAEQSIRVRSAAFDRYGKAWAFDYQPEDFEESIARYNLRLREVIDA